MSKAKGSTYSHSETVAEGFLQGVNLDCNDLKIPSLQAAPASGSLCDGTSTWCSLIPSAGEPFPSPTPSSEQPLLTSCFHTQDCRFEDELSPHVEMMENAPPSWENFTLDKSPAEDDTIRSRSPKELSTPALLQQALSDHNLLSTPEGFTDTVHGGGEGAALSNKKASGDGATNIPSTLDAPAPRGGLDVTMAAGATTTPSHGARAELDMDTQVVLNDPFPYCFRISSNTSKSALSSQGIVFTQRFRGGVSTGGVKEGEIPPPETSEANERPQDREESRSQTSRELNYGLKGEERDASCTATHRSVSSSASCFTVGMPVEVHMDALWHSATVIESEKDGHVVVNVCEDETVLRLPVGMVRRASLMDSDGTESAHYFVEEPIIRHPNVVDICATAGSGNKPVCSQGVTLNARCGYTQDNEIGGWVHPSTLVIFVEPRANESLSCGSRLVLENLVKLGLTVVQCLEELESSRSAADSGLQGKGGQYCTRHYSGVYFVVVSVSENSAKEEAYNVVAAHAMGISAVSVQWLERLYSDGAWNQRRVGLPLRDELVGQGSCDILRYHLLRREQRVFTSNVVYVPECEHEIELLIELCGAVVTHTLPQHDEVDVVGHFAYANVIGQFQETGEFHSLQQVDQQWLFHRIHEFFAELPPTRGVRSACNCDNVTDYNALSNKHRRDETWGRGAFDECYLRPDLTDSSAAHVRSELYPLRPTCATDEMNEIRVGDDYYFCIPSKSPSYNRNSETRSVGIGRVLEVTNDRSGHRSVTMRIYQSKETERSQGEHDNRNLNSHQRIYMGTQSVVIKESDLVFDTPVYVLKASEMAHLFIVESPPRDAELGPEELRALPKRSVLISMSDPNVMVGVTSGNPLVVVESASFQYPRNSLGMMDVSAPRNAIRGVSFSLYPGDRVLVVGRNGSGKSTLLSLVAGRHKASHGRVTVMGADAFEDTKTQRYVTLIGDPWPTEAFFGTTVDQLTSPAPMQDRKKHIADALNLNLQESVCHMSTGLKRRVQILHGMLQKSFVYLLDECSVDVDVAERKTVLELIKEECTSGSGCCLYATHILDGVGDWATHMMLMQDGEIVNIVKMSDICEPVETFAYRFLSRISQTSEYHSPITTEQSKLNEHMVMCPGDGASTHSFHQKGETVVLCNNLKFRDLFDGLSFEVYRGDRVVLCGCNGVGKTTLLNMMGGIQYFDNSEGALRIHGKVCYEDMSLNGFVTLAGNWWAQPPPCEIYVHQMVNLATPRAKELCELLAVDLNWDVRHLSSGEQKRVQLLLHLQEERSVVLVDEATSNLDLDMRYALMSFLYSESVTRGVTIIYVTHIFDGLESWPTAVMMLDHCGKKLHKVWRIPDGNSGGICVSMRTVVEELMRLKLMEREVNVAS